MKQSLKEKWTKFKEEHQELISDVEAFTIIAGVTVTSIICGYQLCKFRTAVDLHDTLIVDKHSDIGRALAAMKRMNDGKACSIYTKTMTNGMPTDKLGELGKCIANLAGADNVNNVKWTNVIMMGSEE